MRFKWLMRSCDTNDWSQCPNFQYKLKFDYLTDLYVCIFNHCIIHFEPIVSGAVLCFDSLSSINLFMYLFDEKLCLRFCILWILKFQNSRQQKTTRSPSVSRAATSSYAWNVYIYPSTQQLCQHTMYSLCHKLVDTRGRVRYCLEHLWASRVRVFAWRHTRNQ